MSELLGDTTESELSPFGRMLRGERLHRMKRAFEKIPREHSYEAGGLSVKVDSSYCSRQVKLCREYKAGYGHEVTFTASYSEWSGDFMGISVEKKWIDGEEYDGAASYHLRYDTGPSDGNLSFGEAAHHLRQVLNTVK